MLVKGTPYHYLSRWYLSQTQIFSAPYFNLILGINTELIRRILWTFHVVNEFQLSLSHFNTEYNISICHTILCLMYYGEKIHSIQMRIWCVCDIKNNAWVTMNNDFWVKSESICRWFSFVTHENHRQIASRVTQKSVFTVTNVLFYFLHAILCPWTQNSAKNNHRWLISQLSPRTVVSDLALWRHCSGSVTSRKREILALWRHICRLFLHAQIGAKAIFTSE